MKSYFSYLGRGCDWPSLGLMLTFDPIRSQGSGEVLMVESWWLWAGADSMKRSLVRTGILIHVSALNEPLEQCVAQSRCSQNMIEYSKLQIMARSSLVLPSPPFPSQHFTFWSCPHKAISLEQTPLFLHSISSCCPLHTVTRVFLYHPLLGHCSIWVMASITS